MLKSTAMILVVAVLVATGVTAAIIHQQDAQEGRAQDAPRITSSTLIVIDGAGARACSSWSSSASSCRPLDSDQPEEPARQD